MNKFIILAISILFSLLLISCSSSKEIETIPVEERYKKAMQEYKDGSYLEAIESFKLITVQYQGSEFSDGAQFYLAECRFNRGEYILASAEYENVIRVTANSPYVPFSRYKKALSFYLLSPKSQLDQKYTKQGLDEFQNFVEFFPKDTLSKDAEIKIAELSDKLAKKVYQSGILYYRMEYYRAAIAYFDNVIEQYHDSKYCSDAYFLKAYSQYERKDYSTALQTLSILDEKYPSYEFKEDIAKLRTNIAYDSAHPNSTIWQKIGRWL